MSIFGLARSGVLPRIVAIGALCACIGLMSGCPVKSINGMEEKGNDPDMVYDARLVGTWPVHDKCTSSLTSTAHEKVYSWQVVDCQSNKTTSYEARLFKLDQHYFLDVTAPSEQVCELCVGVHLIYLVNFEKDSVVLAPLDYDWFKTALQKKRVRLTTLPDDPSTITASAKDLKAFCRKYADDKEAFKPDSDSILKPDPDSVLKRQ